MKSPICHSSEVKKIESPASPSKKGSTKKEVAHPAEDIRFDPWGVRASDTHEPVTRHISPERGKIPDEGVMNLSRTTWLVITIVGLTAFIVGGGVALVDGGTRTSSASNAPVVTAPPSPSATGSFSPSPSAEPPPVTLAEEEAEGDGHGKHGKAKGHDKKGHEEHGKAKGHHDHHGDQGEED
jgi:hypothetical protein